jgi:hypothetical protein
MTPEPPAPDEVRADPISLMAALLAGKKVAPDATDLLIQDHRAVQGWFREHQALSEETAKSFLVRQICLALEAHMAFEEAVFYAAARDLIGDDALVDHAVEEHDEAKSLMADLRKDGGPGHARDTLMAALEAAVTAHVTEEEAMLFPAVRASGADLYALGRALAARRAEAYAEFTGKPAPPTPEALKDMMEPTPH